jgi:hypothetical protein
MGPTSFVCCRLLSLSSLTEITFNDQMILPRIAVFCFMEGIWQVLVKDANCHRIVEYSSLMYSHKPSSWMHSSHSVVKASGSLEVQNNRSSTFIFHCTAHKCQPTSLPEKGKVRLLTASSDPTGWRSLNSLKRCFRRSPSSRSPLLHLGPGRHRRQKNHVTEC